MMIEIEDVHLTLASAAGPVHILRGVDLDVPAGAAVSVVGPSGSGKSSLLALIGGIERATRGRVAVDGIDLASLDEDGLALFRRERVGILFQAFHLIPTLTAAENVALPLELRGAPDAPRRAADALAEVGLSDRLRHYPSQLSGGEQQRVALARALINAPRLLLADEPTGNLDTGTGRAIVELMFRLQAERRTTLLLITHDQRLAARCGRQVAIEAGRLREIADEAEDAPARPVAAAALAQ
jgi:putative ABC transport system ATP-binding protein